MRTSSAKKTSGPAGPLAMVEREAAHRALFRLAIRNVPAHQRIGAPQLEAGGIILTILLSGVGMPALSAAQLDDDAITLLASHSNLPLYRLVGHAAL